MRAPTTNLISLLLVEGGGTQSVTEGAKPI